MRGEILGFDKQASTGVISGEDGNRYSFAGLDVQENFSAVAPGAKVDFTTEDTAARSIYITEGAGLSLSMGPKDKLVAALLAIFLGGLGIHKFYLGKKNAGIIMLVISLGGVILLFIPTFIIGVIAFIEGIIYLVKSEDDFKRDYIDGNKAWF
ncbi:TM2 domain-containing protein [Roseovarius sp. S4756]|uniref:TM2 domain-containing protein n=1 Tax=Roseovarius maritimus TaxID=3342637 RepID=UPI0037262BC5